MQFRFSTLIVVLLMVSPAAAAWAGKGHAEPDTLRDATDGFMWPDADTTPLSGNIGHRVYFNSITVQNTGYVTHGVTLNPNYATVGSSRQDWPGNVAALLGVWKDCNADGYIGWGDNAFYEYRAELLGLADVGTTICPAQNPYPVPPGSASFNWVSTHNDGVWVREFIPIGPHSRDPAGVQADANPFDLPDRDARVWADWNAPGDLPPGSRCNVVFTPEGTYHSTGAFLQFADCLDGFFVTDTWNGVIGSVNGDNLGLGQLSFEDAPRDQGNSASQLNRPNPWGDEGSAAMYTAFDCNQAPLTTQTVSGQEYRVSRPSGSTTVNTAGTAAGTANSTENAFEDCDRSDGSYQSLEHAPYYAETTGTINQAGVKTLSDFPMSYNEGSRPPVTPAAAATNAALGRAASKDPLRQFDSEGLWISDTRIAEDRNPYLDRANVRDQQVFAGVQYVTSYAYLSPGAITRFSLDLPKGSATGTYGFENCGALDTGIRNGWQCDPDLWYHECSEGYGCVGTVEGQVVDISVLVGQAYRLRDVDCYDHSVTAARELGVSWGTLTGTACV